jgi:Plants and Prokaryotes Conserved (PCC) domain
MRSKQVSENPKTHVIVLETGDEVLASLNGFAQAEHLAASSFKAIEALSSVEVGWFNWDSKEYQIAVKLDEQVELLSLIGDIALKDNAADSCPSCDRTERRHCPRWPPVERNCSADLRNCRDRKPSAPSERD